MVLSDDNGLGERHAPFAVRIVTSSVGLVNLLPSEHGYVWSFLLYRPHVFET
jgi:hypothetical protein